jgi:hypothetical protein
MLPEFGIPMLAASLKSRTAYRQYAALGATTIHARKCWAAGRPWPPWRWMPCAGKWKGCCGDADSPEPAFRIDPCLSTPPWISCATASPWAASAIAAGPTIPCPKRAGPRCAHGHGGRAPLDGHRFLPAEPLPGLRRMAGRGRRHSYGSGRTPGGSGLRCLGRAHRRGTQQADAECVFDFKLDPLGRRPGRARNPWKFSPPASPPPTRASSKHKGEHVLVVAHAGVIRMVISHVLGMPPARAYRINVGSAGLARIRVEHKGARRLDTLMWLSKGA